MNDTAAKKRKKSPPPRENVKLSLADAIDAGWTEMEEIKSELDDWRSNMEEKLSNSPKYAELEDAVNELEQIDDPDRSGAEEVGDLVGDLTVNLFKHTKRGLSRSKRLSNAASYWEAAGSAIRKLLQDADDLDYNPEDPDFDEDVFSEDDVAMAVLVAEHKDRLEELADALENGEQTMGGVDCPGMY